MRTIQFLGIIYAASLLHPHTILGTPFALADYKPDQASPVQGQTQTPPPAVIMPTATGPVPVTPADPEPVHCCIERPCPNCSLCSYSPEEGFACCANNKCCDDFPYYCYACCCRHKNVCAICRCRHGNMLCCQVCSDHGSCGIGCHHNPMRCSARCSRCAGLICLPACLCASDSWNSPEGGCSCHHYVAESDENCTCLAKDTAKDCAIAGITPLYPLCLLAQTLYSSTRVCCCPERLPGCLQGHEAGCDRTCGLCVAEPHGEHCWPYEELCDQPDMVHLQDTHDFLSGNGYDHHRHCCCLPLNCCGYHQ